MANNPIFAALGAMTWNAANITAANTTRDGTGTVDTIATGKVTVGTFIRRIVIRPRGTNVVTVMRVFINNGSTNATAANNSLFAEITLPATTATEVASIPGYEIQVNEALPPGYKINVTLGTAVAAGFSVTAVGGDY